MASIITRHVSRNASIVRNSILYSLRMCNQDVSRESSSGQSSNVSSATYGAPEYYQYNEYSFNDIHAEMEKYRLPRPSSKSKQQPK